MQICLFYININLNSVLTIKKQLYKWLYLPLKTSRSMNSVVDVGFSEVTFITSSRLLVISKSSTKSINSVVEVVDVVEVGVSEDLSEVTIITSSRSLVASKSSTKSDKNDAKHLIDNTFFKPKNQEAILKPNFL